MIEEGGVFYVIYRILSNTISNDTEFQDLLQSINEVEYHIYQDVRNSVIEGNIRFEQEWFSYRGKIGDRSCFITVSNRQDESIHYYNATFTNDGKVDLVEIGNCQNNRYDEMNTSQWKRQHVSKSDVCEQQREKMEQWNTKRICNLSTVQENQNCLINRRVKVDVSYQSSRKINSFYSTIQGYEEKSSFPKIDSYLQILTIFPAMYNHKDNNSFILTGCLQRLQKLIVNRDSIINVSTFSLTGIPRLQTVLIDNKCGSNGAFSNPSTNASNSGFNPGHFLICNCPMLGCIQIGSQSFGRFNQFEIYQLSRLKTIEIGSGSFYLCSEVKMHGMELQ